MSLSILSRNTSLRSQSQISKLASLSNVQRRFATGGFTPSDMPIIKNKWQAAEKVGKICESMKNVAAGALPGCERHLAQARPFGSLALPLFELEEEPSDIKKVLHICVGTERGMCGSISSNTVRGCVSWIEKNGKEGQEHKVIVYGRRSSAVANTSFGQNMLYCAGEVKTRVPTYEFCCQIAENIMYEQEWDKIVLYFNEYENAVRFHIKNATIYKTELAAAIAEIQFPSYEIEGDETIIIQDLVEFKLASQLYMYLAENAASEQGARLQSMDGAVKNCNEMTDEYEKIYQGLRKSKITNELIVSAAGAKLAFASNK